MKDILSQDLSKYKVLVVGDSILDKYYYGEVNRISPEAPVPINHIIEIKNKLGGAANVANALSTLGLNTSLITHIGNDANGNVLLSLFKNINIFPIRTEQITTTKIRILSNNQQMMRLDFEDQLVDLYNLNLINILSREIINNNIIIISDYGKGFCSESICQHIIKQCNQLNKIVIIDPKRNNWNKYKNATYITPNLKELSDIMGHKVLNTDSNIRLKALTLIERFNLTGLLVTRSEKGLSFISNEYIVHKLTQAKEVIDVCGAGDTVVAIFALGLLLKLNFDQILQLANLAASITVSKSGVYNPTINELILNLVN